MPRNSSRVDIHPMESADVEKAWRCVLQHDVVELASFCSFASASKTALRCASDAEVDTLRWRPEFQRRFPFLSSTQSRTLSVARSAKIWQGEECRFSTCWRRTYLSCVQTKLRAVPQGVTSNGMLQHCVQAGQFDRACKEVEQGGAAFEDFDTALELALLPAVLLTPELTPERDAARGLFVASVLASQSRPLSEAPDGGYVRGALPRAAKNLHVSAVRAVLTSQWFRASTVLYRRNQISDAIERYLETSFDIDSLVHQHPQRMLLEGQPGYDQNAPWVTDLAFLRSMSDDYRENLCTFYRRATTIGEMLRGVAVQKAGDDVAGIDARLELLRIATANLEENAGYVHDGNEWVRGE